MNESDFWTRRVRPIIYTLPEAMAERVENGVASGTPDAFFCVNGVSGWIENKYRKEPPKRANTPVFGEGKGLRKEQLVWWTVYLRAYGHGFIAAGVGGAGYLVRATLPSIHLFNEMTLADFARERSLASATWRDFL